eukprot:TRINITY_DN778309_c0_g1_i1.p1 TRINITY_DN778309_c0_g1~~TRINITY_DN778309_c0_g1_i1.p1  ORF type:complete len:189 (+),score=58.51 TRINITY_DN778309_c0_g1_i1:64-630(+)
MSKFDHEIFSMEEIEKDIAESKAKYDASSDSEDSNCSASVGSCSDSEHDDSTDFDEEDFAHDESDEEDFDDWEPRPGSCELCGSYVKLSLHHLIPKLQMRRLKKKKIKSETVLICLCNKCHGALHRFFTHKELGQKYYSAELLRGADVLRDYLIWRRKASARERVPEMTMRSAHWQNKRRSHQEKRRV